MAAENTTDLDFWEFVSCAKCHLPYASEPGKSMPFWLTECGHVICNNHLNPNQSCSSCGSTGILLVPLQRELDAPMSEWFKSIPTMLDLAAFAAKFQQEVMARQIRFFRGRHQQIRTVLEKLRSDIAELKRTNEALVQENNQLKQQLYPQDLGPEDGHEPLNVINQNGKRQMGIRAYQYDYPSSRPRTGSSPLHSSATPTRRTLPISQRTTERTHSNERSRPTNQMQPPAPSPQHGTNQGNVRPISRQIGNFAYIPPESSHTPATSLPHAQTAPNLILPSHLNRNRHNDHVKSNVQSQTIQHRTSPSQRSVEQQSQLGNMGPPPVPRARLGTSTGISSGTHQVATSNRRFVPPQRHQQQPSTSSHDPQRFFPRPGQNSSGSWANPASNSGGKSSGVGYG